VLTISVKDGGSADALNGVGVLSSNTATSTITVVPVNDAPTLDLDGNDSSTATGANYKGSYKVGSATGSAIADSDTVITDADSGNLSSATIMLTNAKVGDSLSFSGTFGAITAPVSVSATADGTLTLTLSGVATKAQYEAAIEAIRFAATGTNYTDRVFNVTVYDDSVQINQTTGMATATSAPLASNTAIATLSVLPDDRLLTVTGTEVNEASPYVLFTVGGDSGQRLTLELLSGTALLGLDTANAGSTMPLQILVSGVWTDYTPGSVVSLSGTTMLVRTAVVNDTLYEGAETVQLVARNSAGIANAITAIRPPGQRIQLDSRRRPR